MSESIYVGDLNPTSKRIAQIIVDRLRWGQSVHGDWADNPDRDWRHEAFEEVLDAVVYLARDETKQSA